MFFIILIVIISIIGLLALHEFGHFIIAKVFGLKVEEFGIGYPPRLFGKKIGKTIYSLNLLPFGAFVRIPGVEKEGEGIHIPAWKKSLVILGGVISFWVIAAILLSIVFSIGVPQAISDEANGNLVNAKVQVLAVSSESPAEEAGIIPGDVIKDFGIVSAVQEFTEENRGKEVTLTIQRGGEVFDISLTPRISPPEGEGAMGVALVRTADKSYPWWQAPIKGIEATIDLTGAVIAGWGKIIASVGQGKGMPAGVQMVGPIGIGILLTQAAQVGISYFIQFIAIIAIYLAILNILPIPALDGGKLLFIIIGKIKGTPVDQKIEEKITAGVFVALIFLMIWVTIQDIIRLF
jgi:regulator of sigma E protease